MFLYGVDVVVLVEVIVCEVFEQGGVGGDFEVVMIVVDVLLVLVVQFLVQIGIVILGKEVKCLIVEGGLCLNNDVIVDL